MFYKNSKYKEVSIGYFDLEKKNQQLKVVDWTFELAPELAPLISKSLGPLEALGYSLPVKEEPAPEPVVEVKEELTSTPEPVVEEEKVSNKKKKG